MDSDPLALQFFVNESESRQSLWNRIPVLDNRKILMLKISFIKLRVNKYRYLHRFYCQNFIICFWGRGPSLGIASSPDPFKFPNGSDLGSGAFFYGSGFRKRIQIRGYKTHFFLLHHKLSVFNVQSCILIDEQIKNGQTVLKYCLLKY